MNRSTTSSIELGVVGSAENPRATVKQRAWKLVFKPWFDTAATSPPPFNGAARQDIINADLSRFQKLWTAKEDKTWMEFVHSELMALQKLVLKRPLNLNIYVVEYCLKPDSSTEYSCNRLTILASRAGKQAR